MPRLNTFEKDALRRNKALGNRYNKWASDARRKGARGKKVYAYADTMLKAEVSGYKPKKRKKIRRSSNPFGMPSMKMPKMPF